MRTKINRRRAHAILLTPEDISALIAEVEKYGEIYLSATCNDGSELTTNDPNDILKFDNPNYRRIERLVIQGGKPRSDDRCALVFEGQLFRSFSLFIDDEDDKRALKIATEVESRVNDCKPWYSPFARITLGWLVSGVFVLYFSTYFLIVTYQSGSLPQSPNFSSIAMLYIVFPLVLIQAFIFKHANKVWEWLFPKVLFAIGRQNTEIQKRANFRKGILGSVAGTLLLGVIGGLITHAITN